MTVALEYPWAALLLPLAILPLLGFSREQTAYSDVSVIPTDRVSVLFDWVLRVASALAILALAFSVGGLHRPGEQITRVGQGAQMVLLLDRSTSMDEVFAGEKVRNWAVATKVNSKGKVARGLLANFTDQRRKDHFAMQIFSTQPIPLIPLTDKPEIVQAAIRSGEIGRGLAETDIGAGLISALEEFDNRDYTGSRIVLLVSDGAAILNTETRRQLKNLMLRYKASIYWIFIRSRGSAGLEPVEGEELAPQQVLHQMFGAMGVPYRAYQAENPKALEQAMADVNRLQNLPILYQDIVPRRELTTICLVVAALLVSLLVFARLLERRVW